MHEWRGDFRERIKRKVTVCDLLLKLGVEKGNALVRDHLGTETGYALTQINLPIGRQVYAGHMTALSPERYDAWYRTLPGRWIGDCEYELLRKCLAVRSDESILDVGCGTGFFTRRFARNHCSTVIGIDLDPATIRYASLHAATIDAYIVARGEALPFPSQSFDLSISITALCFVDDQMRFLREMARVTRRCIAVGLLNRRSLLWRRKGHAGEESAYHGAHWHTREEIIELLTAVGFSNISVHTAINLPSGSAMARLFEQMLPSSWPWGSFLLAVCDITKQRFFV